MLLYQTSYPQYCEILSGIVNFRLVFLFGSPYTEKWEGMGMDYLAFSKKYFSATGIPANLYKDGHVLYSSLGELLGIEPQDAWTIYEPDRNPEFSAINPNLEYGHIRIEGTGYDLFLGPIFTSPVSEELVHEYFVDSRTPPEHQEAVAEMLYAIPINSHPHFVRMLTLLHYVLNGKEVRIEDFYAEDEAKTVQRSAAALEKSIESKENETRHNSYDFERKLYHVIAQGDPKRLKSFLESSQEIPTMGKVARTPLRQAKNIFIELATKVGMLGAIPGGVDVERTYQLVDLYILECEQLQTIDEIKRLQYIMLMDFCKRAGEAQLPEGISAEIYRCMTYIQSHTNEPIGIEDVAEEIHRSSSYLMRRFKAELGMSVGDYITKCKLEEACDLLVYSEHSLAEISAYLGYSSQSYFQNVFKKQFGMTPMQYRKQNRRSG